MLFYTAEYIFFFLPIVLFLYYQFTKYNLDHKLLIIFSSIFFYGYWDIKYLYLIFIILILNFYFGKQLTKYKKGLIFYIFFNIIILIIFKYLDFIIENLNLLFRTNIELLNLPFPLALSFITFQTIAYLVNCLDKEIKLKDLTLKNFFIFILFFPQLIAGPIVKFNEMINQFDAPETKKINYQFIKFGLAIFFIRFIKKVFLSGQLELFVNNGYANLDKINFIYAWFISFSFTLQFYFDFSGYVDMATGSSLLFNIILPRNFNSPYKASSIIDFWQRWHITLTNFLTYYVYTPWIMSLKKNSFFKSMVILVVVFILAGLWHGPSWNYVIFGLLNGLALTLNHIYRKYIKVDFFNPIKIILTFLFVNYAFVFFRTKNIQDAITMIKKMSFINSSYDPIDILRILDIKFLIIFSASLFVCFAFENSNKLIENLRTNKD